MTDMEHTTKTFSFVGEHLGLDFTNTVGSHASDTPNDYFQTYVDVVAWARQADILTDDEQQRLIREAADLPDDAQAALEHAIALRDVIYRIFAAIANEHKPDADDLAALNQNLAEALSHLQVAQTIDGFDWGWNRQRDQLDWF